MRFASTSIRLTFAVLGLSAMAACSDDPKTVTPAPTPDPVVDSGPVPTPDAGPKPDAAPALKDIVDTAVANGSFKILAGLLTDAGLVTTLKGDGPFTVLAPTDAAFNALEAKSPGILAALKNNLPLLRRVLTYHVIAGAKILSKDLPAINGRNVGSGNGENLKVTATAAEVKFNDSKVIIADVEATNGVIHAIDAVLVSGIVAENLKGAAAKDIIDTAVAAGTFGTLAAALTACDLVMPLKGAGPFTVFAPSDAAFTKAGITAAAVVGCPAAVKDILTYHVFDKGTRGSASIAGSDKSELTMLNTKKVTIKVTGADVFLTDLAPKDVKVVTVDIAAKNGLIHVLDNVLIPTKAN
jgi:transforming growth factor-beta-induced protein